MIVAIVGRPNVGKSTLFNRLVGRRQAIVEDVPGVTRDRHYAAVEWPDRQFVLVDTGGLEPETGDELVALTSRYARQAVEEADLILFVTDVHQGVLPADEEIARYLRQRSKDVAVVVNKVDGARWGAAALEFHAAGFESVVPVSAEHGLGIDELVAELERRIPAGTKAEPEVGDAIRVAVLGRPNVGKSSLVNRILGQERVAVSPKAGTTRDPIDTRVRVAGREYLLIDTAGIRRKSRVEEGAERWSSLKAIRTIDRAHVCVLLLDAAEGFTDQDARILNLVQKGGRGLILGLNKWDLVAKDEKTFDRTVKDLRTRLGPHGHVPILSFSALTGQRVFKLFDAVDRVHEQWVQRVPTAQVNEFLEAALRELPPPVVGGKRTRIYYMTQVHAAPPRFAAFSSFSEGIPPAYERFLLNRLRAAFGFEGGTGEHPLSKTFPPRRSGVSESRREEAGCVMPCSGAGLSAEELWTRSRRLQARMAEDGLRAVLLLQNVDRYYFSGSMQGGYVLVPVQGEPLILVRRDPDRAVEESPLPVESLGSVRELANQIRTRFGEVPSPLGLEFDVLPAAQVERLKGLLPGAEFRDASRAIAMTRAVKSPWELARIREAARVVAGAVETVPKYLASGVSELELSARLEAELRLRGHGGLIRMRGFNQEIFYGHVMAGAAAATPSFVDAPTGGLGMAPALPHGASGRPIEAGAPVVVDLVGNCAGYLSDQTRVFCLGVPEEPFAAAFVAALEVEEAVAGAARPGVLASHLYQVALDVAASTPYARHFMGDAQRVSFVGHGIGLEVDEFPFLARGFDLPLEEGMVFAVEPKFVFHGRGVVGVEDTFVVTATGVERLTPSPQVLRMV